MTDTLKIIDTIHMLSIHSDSLYLKLNGLDSLKLIMPAIGNGFSYMEFFQALSPIIAAALTAYLGYLYFKSTNQKTTRVAWLKDIRTLTSFLLADLYTFETASAKDESTINGKRVIDVKHCLEIKMHLDSDNEIHKPFYNSITKLYEEIKQVPWAELPDKLKSITQLREEVLSTSETFFVKEWNDIKK